jgi:hypothetical protein
MYARVFHRAHQTRRFAIVAGEGSGWEIREEEDSRLLRRVQYTDWHRVERARMVFARQAADLADDGWTEA